MAINPEIRSRSCIDLFRLRHNHKYITIVLNFNQWRPTRPHRTIPPPLPLRAICMLISTATLAFWPCMVLLPIKSYIRQDLIDLRPLMNRPAYHRAVVHRSGPWPWNRCLHCLPRSVRLRPRSTNVPYAIGPAGTCRSPSSWISGGRTDRHNFHFRSTEICYQVNWHAIIFLVCSSRILHCSRTFVESHALFYFVNGPNGNTLDRTLNPLNRSHRPNRPSWRRSCAFWASLNLGHRAPHVPSLDPSSELLHGYLHAYQNWTFDRLSIRFKTMLIWVNSRIAVLLLTRYSASSRPWACLYLRTRFRRIYNIIAESSRTGKWYHPSLYVIAVGKKIDKNHSLMLFLS